MTPSGTFTGLRIENVLVERHPTANGDVALEVPTPPDTGADRNRVLFSRREALTLVLELLEKLEDGPGGLVIGGARRDLEVVHTVLGRGLGQ